jgi:transposase
MSTFVLKYRLLPPISNEKRIRAQMYAAHRYRNMLVRLERDRRGALRALGATEAIPLVEQFEIASRELTEARAAINAARSETRSRSETAEMREVAKAAKEKRFEAMKLLIATRKEIKDTNKEAIDIVNAEASAKRKAAREEIRKAPNHLFWGTYLQIEASDEQVRKMPLYDGVEPNDPRFVRWEGHGAVGVQLQGGLAEALAYGTDTRLRISRNPNWKRSENEPELHLLHMRIGSEGRAPVWGVWPMLYSATGERVRIHHPGGRRTDRKIRPVPKGATIKWAKIMMKRLSDRETWWLCLTVECPEEVGEPTAPTVGGAVAVDIGWRVFDEDLRVAVAADEKKNRIELRLPLGSGGLGHMRKAEEIASRRGLEFDAARDRLFGQLTVFFSKPPVENEHLAWLQAAVADLAKWRSAHRLYRLYQDWSGLWEGKLLRHPTLDAFLLELEAWAEHDRHLWQWERHAWDVSLRQRREQYRIFAAKLAKSYDTLVLEKFDLRKVARRPVPESEEENNDTARHNRQLAAVGELRTCLEQSFVKRRREVVREAAEDSTHICHHCGSVEKFDAAQHLEHVCGSCGQRWDQDDNAAEVLLARYKNSCEHKRAEESTGGARVAEKPEKKASRWSKRKKKEPEGVPTEEPSQPDA